MTNQLKSKELGVEDEVVLFDRLPYPQPRLSAVVG